MIKMADSWDFKVQICGRFHKIHRAVFKRKFPSFFEGIEKNENSFELSTGDRRRDEAIGKVFHILIDFAYNSENSRFSLPEEDLYIELHLAVTYHRLVNSTLVRVVEQQLKSNLTTENVYNRLKYAKQYKWTELGATCYRWIGKHEDRVLKMEDQKKDKKRTFEEIDAEDGNDTDENQSENFEKWRRILKTTSPENFLSLFRFLADSEMKDKKVSASTSQNSTPKKRIVELPHQTFAKQFPDSTESPRIPVKQNPVQNRTTTQTSQNSVKNPAQNPVQNTVPVSVSPDRDTLINMAVEDMKHLKMDQLNLICYLLSMMIRQNSENTTLSPLWKMWTKFQEENSKK